MAERLKRDTRRMILETARKNFLQSGVKRTTMEEIAHALKISKKTLYAEFPSKQAIWEELVRIEAYKTAEYLKTYLSDDSSPLERLGKLAGYYLRRQVQAREEERDRLLTANLVGGLTDEIQEDAGKRLREEGLEQAFPQLVEGLVVEAQKAGEAMKGDTWLFARLTVGLVNTIITTQQERPSELPPVKEYIRRLLTI
ncbi:MAG: TetR/AcrR family transcriptional regulator [bacterium]|nr:TetR/AcrR family transcriptional regulator [bacterium]